MTGVAEGLWGWLALAAAIALMHESWRWAGLWLSRDVAVDSEIFRWVQCVANALVAGLVTRLVLFPIGALAEVELTARLAATVIGLAAYVASGKRLAAGVLSGAAALAALSILMT